MQLLTNYVLAVEESYVLLRSFDPPRDGVEVGRCASLTEDQA